VVGHGGAFRHAACELGVLSRSDVARLSMDYCGPVYLEAEAAPLEASGAQADQFRHIAGSWRLRQETQPVD
jgi:2,3-bisphosphoglycerate-dependent phosphoglycerate mutase